MRYNMVCNLKNISLEEKNMKRFLALVLAILCLALCLVGCDKKEEKKEGGREGTLVGWICFLALNWTVYLFK